MATSLPPPASVIPSAMILSPASTGGATRCFSSSDPSARIGGRPMPWVISEAPRPPAPTAANRSEEHTSELQSLMRISYAVFCLKKKKKQKQHINTHSLQIKSQHNTKK